MSAQDTNAAVVRLWAEATAGMIEVAEAFWTGLINLNPVERDTDSAVGEGRTSIPAVVAASTLQATPFLDAHNNPLPGQQVQIEVGDADAATNRAEVRVKVTATGPCHGRFTGALVDQTGAEVSGRFSVYMAQG